MKNIIDFFPHESFFPFQKEVIEIIDENYDKSKYFFIEAPPGIGKTPIATAIAEFANDCDVLTKQIRLQEQYYKYDFVSVRGRGNFNCLNSSNRCSSAPCIIENEYKCQYKPSFPTEGEALYSAGVSNKRGELFWKVESPHCNYWQQKMDALNAVKRVHNYVYYIYETNYAGDFGSPSVLIGDECHNIEGVLMDFVKVEITRVQLEKVGVLLQNFTTSQEWMTWLSSIVTHYIPRRLSEIEKELTENMFKNYKVVSEKKALETLSNKIKFFLTHYDKNPEGWIILPHVYRGKIEKVEFKPLFVHEFASPLLFKEAQKVILMSGTILDFDIYARSLGLKVEECVTLRVPSPFPVSNRPIYKANIGFLDAKGTNPRSPDNLLNEIIYAIDTILSSDHFADTKGIIHTTTYQLARYIKEHSSHATRMLTHTDSAGASLILEEHANTTEPTILISPSMTEGVDLYDGLSRIQICVKVPYGNTLDPVINARRKLDPAWYYCQAGIHLFQSMARSNRNPTDHSTTIMLDSRFSYFITKQLNNQVPSWISDAIKSQKDLENDLGLYLKMD